ncbi:MAG: type II toxin-antitoxin system RelB/DinJ family antitoxin [Elusimicrobiota bacterium]|jgi:DNA-damage-inducible protein J|nr:type II toxin-antitoxin system RelB/DinJ family antitoxin [Elusimicrobiota bacterium]
MAQINIRIDDNLKKQADTLFGELGLNMSTAFNIFLHQTIRKGAIPFEITTKSDPFYNPENMKLLKQAMMALDNGKGIERELIEK